MELKRSRLLLFSSGCLHTPYPVLARLLRAASSRSSFRAHTLTARPSSTGRTVLFESIPRLERPIAVTQLQVNHVFPSRVTLKSCPIGAEWVKT